MIIGLPTNDREKVEAHFGHCKEFAMYEIEEGRVMNLEQMIYLNHFLVQKKK